MIELQHQTSFLTIIADKGYIGDKFASELKSEKKCNLISLKRGKSKNPLPKHLRQMIFKARRRIETTFSQLSEQLNMQRVLDKSMWGLISIITNIILAQNSAILSIKF